MKLLSIAIGAILVNNFILSQFLGICPFMGVSKKMDTAVGMGSARISPRGIHLMPAGSGASPEVRRRYSFIRQT